MLERQDQPAAALVKLRSQLRLLIPALAIGEGRPEVTAMLAGLKETAAQAEVNPTVDQHEILTAIGAALRHAGANRYNEARTELLAAYHDLAELLHCEPLTG